MENIQRQGTKTFLVLVLLLKAVFNDQDANVKLASSVTAWEGSCAVLPCEIISTKTIDHYMWFYNPVYDDKTKDYIGPIVYHSTKKEEVDSYFKGKVEYRGKTDKDCTILLKDLQRNDTGQYKLRQIWKTSEKWMPAFHLSLTVSETSPGLTLQVPEMQENNEVTLTCSLDFYCPLYTASLTWITDVKGTVTRDVQNEIYMTMTTTLTFPPSWEDNNKSISCVLDRMDGAKENVTKQLNVKYAPKNVRIISESPINLIEGKNVTLECSVESSNPPDVTITWYKNGQKLPGTKANQKHFEESGRYQCEAKNSVGTRKSNTVEISVLHPPKSVSIQKPKGNIQEGSPVTLNCSTFANPPVFLYIWYKNERQCFNSTDSRYEFSRITERDSGSYECEAYNDQGHSRSTPEKLDVKYAPKNVKVVVKPDQKEFLEATVVSFECVVNSSNPNVTKITWNKNNRRVPLYTGNKPIQAADAGTYTCEATNEIGTSPSDSITVEVLYKPKVSKCIIYENNKKEHEEVTLKCPSQNSHPDISSYQWFKSNKLYKTTNSESMKITNVQFTDSGYYSCTAINTIGNSPEADCPYLRIQYAPKNVTVIMSPGNDVTENTNVKLKCTAKANPNNVTYTWYHNKEPLQNGLVEYVLDNVQLSHMGEYYCIVKNPIGSNRSQVVYLHVSYSSYTIAIYIAASIIPLIILILIVALIIRFRICFRLKTCRKTKGDTSESAFFVLKRAHNELSDQLGQQTPPEDSLTEQINYASLHFPTSMDGGQSQPGTETSYPDPDGIYSVVKKPKTTADYENIESSKKTEDDSQDDIHYSIIANLNKGPVRERDEEVEYAMLKQ